MNVQYIIGNLVRDPETRQTQSGIHVCNFTVAVNRTFANADGGHDADFFNVVAWRQLGDNCQQYLAKGRQVAVVGAMQSRTYQAQDGSTRSAWELIANQVKFLTPANQHNTVAATAPAAATATAQQPAVAPNYDAAPAVEYAPLDTGFTQVDDDELPF